MNNLSQTKQEIRIAWDAAHYKRYTAKFRYDTDQEIINYIEANKERFGTTEIFRAAMEMLIANGGIK